MVLSRPLPASGPHQFGKAWFGTLGKLTANARLNCTRDDGLLKRFFGSIYTSPIDELGEACVFQRTRGI